MPCYRKEGQADGCDRVGSRRPVRGDTFDRNVSSIVTGADQIDVVWMARMPVSFCCFLLLNEIF